MDLDARFCDSGWSEEYDCVPLRLRFKHLGQATRNPECGNVDSAAEGEWNLRPQGVSVDIKEDGHLNSEDWTSMNHCLSSRKISDTEVNGAVRHEQLNNSVDSFLNLTSSDVPGGVQTVRDSMRASSNALLQGTKIKPEISYEFDDSLDDIVLGERRMVLSWKLLQSSVSHMKDGHNGESSKSSKPLFQGAGIDMQGSVDAIGNSALSLFARVKDEPVDVSEFCNGQKSDKQNIFTSEIVPVKNETEFSEFFGELDHLLLIDRLKLMSSGIPNLDASPNVEFLTKNVASDMDVGIDILESVKPISISRPRKRSRTATDSAEIALEEDAPGLLKVLRERGISAEDIKLYGVGVSEDDLDDSFSEDGFSELEAVISQLFSQRQPFMKFPVIRCSKGAKANYCLSCLLSLVEQARYLQLRKWPVEWGWCRDLQSFIFVFQRHNRIVLERPEYGFATYFFELLSSVSADWQVKRLVTAMKLTNCGRFTLLENKPLLVGDDLSEGEARVLAEYGWIPNTGLGTMLNFCDRVVHDRKQETTNISEWRSKIAKQLMNGYDGGSIITKNLPKKVLECQGSDIIQVKVEE